MSERPKQSREGKIIADAAKRRHLSGRRAAGLAGLSSGRWYQIVNGYQTVNEGVYVEVRAPADTVARMASVVGVTGQQLIDAGREDAAAQLVLLAVPGDGAASADGLPNDPRFEELRREAMALPPNLRDLWMENARAIWERARDDARRLAELARAARAAEGGDPAG